MDVDDAQILTLVNRWIDTALTMNGKPEEKAWLREMSSLHVKTGRLLFKSGCCLRAWVGSRDPKNNKRMDWRDLLKGKNGGPG